jgi:hypothetical protein
MRRQKMHRAGDAFVRPSDRPPPKRLPVGEPSTLGAPYSVHRRLYGPDGSRSSTGSTKFGAICGNSKVAVPSTRISDDLAPVDPQGQGSTTKCTEPVAPSSGFPTDLRRSDCLSGSHQPWTLRTRCNHDTRAVRQHRQGRRKRTLRKLRDFLFAQGQAAIACVCSGRSTTQKRAGHEGPAAKSSPSRERFRPPSRRTFRFRVVLLGGLRPTGAPCSAQEESMSRHVSDQGVLANKLVAICGGPPPICLPTSKGQA